MSTTPQTLTKQPAESRLYDFDFVNLLPAGALVQSVALIQATLVEGTGDINVGPPAISGTRVQIRIDGGSDAATFKLTCRIVDTDGNTVEQEGFLAIEDI